MAQVSVEHDIIVCQAKDEEDKNADGRIGKGMSNFECKGIHLWTDENQDPMYELKN